MAQTVTQSARVFDTLRTDILRGELLPGQRLGFEALRQRYGASMGVLRESLSRLEEKQLVTSEPGLGFKVITISPEDLTDLTEARCALETLTLRRAVTEGDLTWESSVVAAYHVLDRTAVHHVEGGEDASITPSWLAAHARYHNLLLAGCGNAHLRNLAAGLRDKAELYRNWCHPPVGEQDVALREHRQLLDAVLDRNADTAAEILSTHINRTNRAIRSWSAEI